MTAKINKWKTVTGFGSIMEIGNPQTYHVHRYQILGTDQTVYEAYETYYDHAISTYHNGLLLGTVPSRRGCNRLEQIKKAYAIIHQAFPETIGKGMRDGKISTD